MSFDKHPHIKLVAFEGTLCPSCNKGSLILIKAFGEESAALECPNCKIKFYENAIGELSNSSKLNLRQNLKGRRKDDNQN